MTKNEEISFGYDPDPSRSSSLLSSKVSGVAAIAGKTHCVQYYIEYILIWEMEMET